MGILSGLAVLHVWSVFFFTLTWQSAPMALLMILLQCWLFVGFFITAHDAMHGSLAPGKPSLNSAIGTFLLFTYAGFGWRKLKTAHMAHHAAPGTEEDPDFNNNDPRRFWPWYFLFFKRYFGLVSFLFVFAVVLVYVLALEADYFNVVLFYGLPSIASSLQLFYFGTYLPHRHEEKDFADQHKARTNDYPAWLSLMTCYHFGYHHEHHLYPHEPWWRLPARRSARLSGQGENT
ncbi:fatty acid desaturase [Parvularcula sp. IMCC14364]|uniref:fatty acid desaturase n=1 Tax=Parvularcula sp. IMCC14364 TaxID=3067902 RepID=UPI00355907E0